jgi:hypothetical protein
MRVQVNSQALHTEAELVERKRLAIAREAWAKLRAVSFALERRIKSEMPKDTGRAAASWGHWTPSLLRSHGAKEAGPTDAVWEENLSELRITQGSNVPYIEALNAGHSRQAPAGFIDRAEEQAQKELDRLIDELMRGW